MTSASAQTLDVRQIPPRDRSTRISARFEALALGEAVQLLSDHDPEHLRQEFDDRSRGRFQWTTLESGPHLWRVQIRKLARRTDPASADSCCSGGACCG